MNRYQEKKEEARAEAIDWQTDFDNHAYTWAEMAEWENHFYCLAKRYGLVREFKENGIL